MAFTTCHVTGAIYAPSTTSSTSFSAYTGTLKLEVCDVNGLPTSAYASDGTTSHRFAGYIDNISVLSTGVDFYLLQGSQFTPTIYLKATYTMTSPNEKSWTEIWSVPDTASADVGTLAVTST
jgi:hypothetical protein